MKYRYQLCRPANGIRKKLTIEDCIDDPKPFVAEETKSRLSVAFPTLQWQQVTDLDGQPWFGEDDTVSFQFGQERDGTINHVLLNDCHVDHVRKACRALEAAAIDSSDGDTVLTG